MTGRGGSAKSATPRAWQRMLSGRRLDLLDPSPLDIEIADIAHGLARVARWNGQTEGPHIYSVAQHSLLVEIIAHQSARLDRKRRLAVLLHDAPEYVIGDMISPFKVVMGGAYKAVERRLLEAIPVALEAFRAGMDANFATPRAIAALYDLASELNRFKDSLSSPQAVTPTAKWLVEPVPPDA